MTSIIKNQIIKHLSKFAKNLSSDRIGLSTLKGEGQLTDLELDEGTLMEVLELPSWIVITKVVCNRLSVKIPWTKLKTHPICLYLDQVEVEMETCRDLRKTAEETKQALQSTPSKYGFPERVVDGMYVHVNSIIGKFKSDTFHADIQIAQLVAQSTSPDWKPADLRYTRIKDMNRGQVLTFKAMEWSTFRLTVDAIEKGSGSPTTPIRLITNQGKICITIKKRLADCSLVTSRLQVLLDDILWVLTDSQIKAVVLHMRSLNPVIQKAAAQSKVHAEAAGEAMSHQTEDPTSRPQNVKTSKELQLLQFFERYDVPETSYHFFTKRVDLHLCDEMNRPETESFKRRIEGGAMQISFAGVSFDYYPYHIASGSRSHWEYFDDAMTLSDKWIHTILAHFKQQYAMARNELKKRTTPSSQAPPINTATPPNKPQHVSPPTRPATPPNANRTQRNSIGGGAGGRVPPPAQTKVPPAQSKAAPVGQAGRTSVKLMSSCMVLRIRGLQLSNVATSDRGANNEENLRNNMFVMSDKQTFHLPPEIPSIHLEYMSYYFPNELDFPVPSPMIYIQMNPMQLRLDITTLLWLNQFAFNILQTLPEIDENAPSAQTKAGQDHIDVRIDALMQKVLIPVPDPVPNQPDRPKILQVQISQVTATNCRVGTQITRPDLSKVLQRFQGVQLFQAKSSFPNDSSDLETLPTKFWQHAYEPNFVLPPEMKTEEERKAQSGSQTNGTPPQLAQPEGRTLNQDVKLTTNSFRSNAADDVWGIKVDQVWADFVGVPSSPDRPVPFIQPLPLNVWVCSDRGTAESKSPVDNLHLIVDTPSFIDVTINHYQLLFLLRLQQSLQTLASNMETDQSLFSKDSAEVATPAAVASRIISLVFPSIHLTLLGPPSSGEPPQPNERKGSVNAANLKHDGKGEDKGRDPEADSGGSILDESSTRKTEDSSFYTSSSEVTDSSPSSDSMEHDLNVSICNNSKDDGSSDARTNVKELKLGPPGAVVVTEPTPNGDSAHPHIGPNTGTHLSGQTLGINGKISNHEPQPPRKNHSIPDLTKAVTVPSDPRGGAYQNLSTSIPKSSSQTSITAQMSALMSASSMGSLDEQGIDFETMSVSSDSSEGFTMISTQSSRVGSTVDLETESGIGSEFSHSLSTTDGHPEQSTPSMVTPVQQDPSSAMESPGGTVEGAATETKPKTDDFQGSIHKLKKVSVMNFDLIGVNAVVQLSNKDVVVRATVNEVGKEEKGDEDFTKYMNKLDSGDYHREAVKAQKEKGEDKPGIMACKAMLRFTSGPAAETLCEGAKDKGFVQLQLKDVDLNFLKSSLTNLSGLVQDELQSDPMPLDITVFNTAITLQDDAPLVYPDTVEAPPLQLKIPSVRVQRSPDGTFHVKGIHPQGISLKATQLSDSTFSSTLSNSSSRSSTVALPSTMTKDTAVHQQTESASMTSVLDENASLRTEMARMKEALCVLERERTSLLTTLEHLQEELLTSDRERDALKDHVVDLSRRVNLGR